MPLTVAGTLSHSVACRKVQLHGFFNYGNFTFNNNKIDTTTTSIQFQELDGVYTERPETVINGRSTFWHADGKFYIYYCFRNTTRLEDAYIIDMDPNSTEGSAFRRSHYHSANDAPTVQTQKVLWPECPGLALAHSKSTPVEHAANKSSKIDFRYDDSHSPWALIWHELGTRSANLHYLTGMPTPSAMDAKSTWNVRTMCVDDTYITPTAAVDAQWAYAAGPEQGLAVWKGANAALCDSACDVRDESDCCDIHCNHLFNQASSDEQKQQQQQQQLSGGSDELCYECQHNTFATYASSVAPVVEERREALRANQTLSAACGETSETSTAFIPQGTTADGKPYYKSDDGYYMYFETWCHGATNEWFLDTDEPSTTARSDLDGDGDCVVEGWLNSNAQTPAGANTWNIFCPERRDPIKAGLDLVPFLHGSGSSTSQPNPAGCNSTGKCSTDSGLYCCENPACNLTRGCASDSAKHHCACPFPAFAREKQGMQKRCFDSGSNTSVCSTKCGFRTGPDENKAIPVNNSLTRLTRSILPWAHKHPHLDAASSGCVVGNINSRTWKSSTCSGTGSGTTLPLTVVEFELDPTGVHQMDPVDSAWPESAPAVGWNWPACGPGALCECDQLRKPGSLRDETNLPLARVVDCSNRDLAFVPTFDSASIEAYKQHHESTVEDETNLLAVIDLHGNRLATIPNGTFNLVEPKTLKAIDLHDNLLKRIPFLKHATLETLNFRNNDIEYVAPYTWSGMRLPFNVKSVCQTLTRLKSVDLRDNNISMLIGEEAAGANVALGDVEDAMAVFVKNGGDFNAFVSSLSSSLVNEAEDGMFAAESVISNSLLEDLFGMTTTFMADSLNTDGGSGINVLFGRGDDDGAHDDGDTDDSDDDNDNVFSLTNLLSSVTDMFFNLDDDDDDDNDSTTSEGSGFANLGSGSQAKLFLDGFNHGMEIGQDAMDCRKSYTIFRAHVGAIDILLGNNPMTVISPKRLSQFYPSGADHKQLTATSEDPRYNIGGGKRYPSASSCRLIGMHNFWRPIWRCKCALDYVGSDGGVSGESLDDASKYTLAGCLPKVPVMMCKTAYAEYVGKILGRRTELRNNIASIEVACDIVDRSKRPQFTFMEYDGFVEYTQSTAQCSVKWKSSHKDEKVAGTRIGNWECTSILCLFLKRH